VKKKQVKRLVVIGAVIVGLPVAFLLFIFGTAFIHDRMPVEWLPEGEVVQINIEPTETDLYSSAEITNLDEIAEIVALVNAAKPVRRIGLPYANDLDFDQSDRWLRIFFAYADGSSVDLAFPYGWQVLEKTVGPPKLKLTWLLGGSAGVVVRSQELPALKELLMSHVEH